MNFEVINKIKTVSLFFALSLVALISTFVIYQTLDINGDNLKNEAKNLEERLNTLIKEKNNAIKKEKETANFLNEHKNLFFIESADQFDLIKFNKDIKGEFETLHPNLKFTSKGELEKTKSNLYQYPFTIEFTYKNPYYLNTLFEYLNENYFYELTNLSYTSNNLRFKIKGNFFSLKEVKNVLNNSNDKSSVNVKKKSKE